MSLISCAIAGASGYSGNELLRILTSHPGVRVERLFAASSAGRRPEELYPALVGRTELQYEPIEALERCTTDILFVALPSGYAMELVPAIDRTRTRAIDLGGDFRLSNPAVYEKFYGREHTAPGLLGSIPYGLPELHRDVIRNATLVANPGCYPTSIILPLAPLLRDGVIETTDLTACSLSGVTGAGRANTVELSYAEMHGNVRAYRVGEHQHTPEIASVLAAIAGQSVAVTFVPHLAPIARGIHSTITARLREGATMDDIAGSYAKAYAGAPFVRWSATRLPELAAVVYTNFIDIGFRFDPASGRVVILSAIDNLIKGAAGQAVQNMNIMVGFNETEGLL